MRVHRIYLPGLEAGERLLLGAEAHHLARVLRVRPGQQIRAFDGEGLEANGQVLEVGDGSLTLRLEAPEASLVEPALKVTVAVGLLKGDKLADVIRQCTELGASRFQPFTSRYADVREMPARKLDRLQRVATEAAKQSGRALVPEVLEPVPVAQLGQALAGAQVLVADPGAGGTLAGVAASAGSLALVTGPEGGFAEAELEDFAAQGFTQVRLGQRILRAETAPVAMLAALLLPEAL